MRKTFKQISVVQKAEQFRKNGTIKWQELRLINSLPTYEKVLNWEIYGKSLS